MSTGSFQARLAIYQRQHGAELQTRAAHAKSSMGPDVAAATAHRNSPTELRGVASHASESGIAAMNAR